MVYLRAAEIRGEMQSLIKILSMGWLRNEAKRRERERYYLLAGMGGRPARRKRRRFLIYAVVTATLASLTLGSLLVWLSMLR